MEAAACVVGKSLTTMTVALYATYVLQSVVCIFKKSTSLFSRPDLKVKQLDSKSIFKYFGHSQKWSYDTSCSQNPANGRILYLSDLHVIVRGLRKKNKSLW